MKKTIYFLTLFIFSFAKFSIAQQSNIDSLNAVLRATIPDTERVKTLAELAHQYFATTPDTTDSIAKKALALAQQIHYKKGIALAYSKLGLMSSKRGDLENAQQFFLKSLAQATEAGDKEMAAHSYNDLARMSWMKGDLDSALAFYTKAASLFETTGNRQDYGVELSNIAGVYYQKSEYPQATKLILQALRILEPLPKTARLASAYSTAGNIYDQTGDKEKAIVYFLKSIEIYQLSDSKKGMSINYSNAGKCFLEQKKFEKAKEYFDKAVALDSEMHDADGLATSYSYLGQISDSLHQPQQAINYFMMAKDLIEKSDNKSDLILIYHNIGIHYMKNNEFAKAEEMFESGLALAKKTGDQDGISDAYLSLFRLFDKKKDYERALSYFKLHVQTKDSIMNSEKVKQIAEMQTKYETEKKDNQIALQTSEIEKQKTLRNSIIGGVGFAGLFSFLLITSRNRRKKAAIEKQMAEVEMKALRAQMNPHFIFNSLNSIMRFVKKNDAASAEDYLGKFAKLIRIILENSRQQEVTLASDLQALQLYMDLEAMRLENKFQYKIEVGEGIDKETVYVPPLLLQPFVENSIWHGISQKEGTGTIQIRIHREENMLRCEIEDDGVGRQSSEEIKKSSGIKSESLGMGIVSERLNMIRIQKNVKGPMFNLIDKEKGTFVLVSLPYVSENV